VPEPEGGAAAEVAEREAGVVLVEVEEELTEPSESFLAWSVAPYGETVFPQSATQQQQPQERGREGGGEVP
jgi:hypothetical protein